jgi:hypothetical protein
LKIAINWEEDFLIERNDEGLFWMLSVSLFGILGSDSQQPNTNSYDNLTK